MWTRVFYLLVASVLTSTAAWSQVRDPAAAEALFRAGREAAERGDHRAACAKFGESNRLDPAVGTVLNIAICEEQLGRLAAAWQHYQEAIQGLPPSDDRLPLALERAKNLEQRVPRLTIRLASSAPSGTRVYRGEVELGPASFGVPLPLDPGSYVFAVEAPGREPKRFSVKLGPSENR